MVYNRPDLNDIRKYAAEELKKLHPTVRRFVNPHIYVAGLEHRLYENRLRLILEQRKLIS